MMALAKLKSKHTNNEYPAMNTSKEVYCEARQEKKTTRSMVFFLTRRLLSQHLQTQVPHH